MQGHTAQRQSWDSDPLTPLSEEYKAARVQIPSEHTCGLLDGAGGDRSCRSLGSPRNDQMFWYPS